MQLIDRRDWRNFPGLKVRLRMRPGQSYDRICSKDGLVKSGKKYHLTGLMSLKHAESPTLYEFKARIVLRRDQIVDQSHNIAALQEVGVNSSEIIVICHRSLSYVIDITLAQCSLKGNKSTHSGVIMAYTFSLLNNTVTETLVLLSGGLVPRECGQIRQPFVP